MVVVAAVVTLLDSAEGLVAAAEDLCPRKREVPEIRPQLASHKEIMAVPITQATHIPLVVVVVQVL